MTLATAFSLTVSSFTCILPFQLSWQYCPLPCLLYHKLLILSMTASSCILNRSLFPMVPRAWSWPPALDRRYFINFQRVRSLVYASNFQNSISIPNLSSNLIHVFHLMLFFFSTCKSHRHLTININKIELLIFPPPTLFAPLVCHPHISR